MLLKILTFFQLILLKISSFIFKLFSKPNNYLWVIGVSETAQNIYRIGKTINPSITVALSRRQRFYHFKYDYELGFISNNYLRLIIRFFYGPILLGYLSNIATHFFYISGVGFLIDIETDYKFLKNKSKKIVCMFVGSDIRSPKLARRYLEENDIDGYINYQNIQREKFNEEKFDNKVKELASITDKYADVIFNFKHCQISYLKKTTYFWPYSYDKDHFNYNPKKFEQLSTIKIVHAPSNPLFKGTPLVRSAIKKLSLKGYNFKYVELLGKSNSQVLDELQDAHIVLNQFYTTDINLGLFAVEAMANHTALLTSYDPSLINEYKIELDGFDSCCFNTKYWEIYDNLKFLLDNTHEIKVYADNGYNFCKKYFSYEITGNYYNSIFMKEKLFLN
jgi:hypothetical protein